MNDEESKGRPAKGMIDNRAKSWPTMLYYAIALSKMSFSGGEECVAKRSMISSPENDILDKAIAYIILN